MNKIDKFDLNYRFLSNFWPAGVLFDGYMYQSVEHAYQAAKTLDNKQRLLVARCSTPGQAKRMGRNVTMRSDWNNVKLHIMEELVRYKFTHNAQLRKKLLTTAPLALEEGNYWGDTFWGVCRGVGSNHLGRILMKIRDELEHE